MKKALTPINNLLFTNFTNKTVKKFIFEYSYLSYRLAMHLAHLATFCEMDSKITNDEEKTKHRGVVRVAYLKLQEEMAKTILKKDHVVINMMLYNEFDFLRKVVDPAYRFASTIVNFSKSE